jgi:hypothetical protein
MGLIIGCGTYSLFIIIIIIILMNNLFIIRHLLIGD